MSEPSTSEGIPEGGGQQELDLLVVHWLRIAAMAYHGFLLSGRGVVVVETGDQVRVSYHPGVPCQCHVDILATYDPKQSAVVSFDDDVFELRGVPTPEDAFEAASAELVNATSH